MNPSLQTKDYPNNKNLTAYTYFNPEVETRDIRTHRVEIPVLWSQLDANGHVNNGTYQFYLDEARMKALEEEGFSIATMRASNIGPVIQKAEIHYDKPLFHPETAIVETTFSSPKGYRGLVIQKIIRKSDLEDVCRAEFDALFFDFNRRRPLRFPKEFIEKYS